MGNALFEAVLREKRGLVFSLDDHDVNWDWIRRARPSGRLELAIPELLEELAGLPNEDEVTDPEFPFILRRRATLQHSPDADPRPRLAQARPHGALRISPADARSLGLKER